MSATYHIRIKKEYAVAVIEDLQKMKAVELIKDDEPVAEWQKKEVRKRIKDTKSDPSIFIDEATVFNLLNND